MSTFAKIFIYCIARCYIYWMFPLFFPLFLLLARGEVYIVPYADDFIIGLQYQSDGHRLKQALEERLSAFNLSFNESKTHLIEFGRFARKK